MKFKPISSDLLITIITLVIAFGAVTAVMAFPEQLPGVGRYPQAYPDPYPYPYPYPLPMAYNTSRVSVASDGTQANGHSSTTSISADGRYVAFSSGASNLVAETTRLYSAVFVHDRQSGETAHVSITSDESQATLSALSPSISPGGRYVAFVLYPGPTDQLADLYVHDRNTSQTSLVSVAHDGTKAHGYSDGPSISADGRYISFFSNASNLVLNDTNGVDDVFVRDLQSNETTRISVASDGTQANGGSAGTAISYDGRYVAFHSDASNLVPHDTNGMSDIFIHDRYSGEVVRVSVASDGTQANGGSWSLSISADGCYVAYSSWASNLVPVDTNNHTDAFVYDCQTGETTRVSVASDGTQANYGSWSPSISADGRYVAFQSMANNLVPVNTDWKNCIYVHDRQTGQTALVPSGPQGFQPNFSSEYPSISGDGHVIAFSSWANNLVTGDTNEKSDVFVYDMLGKTTPANRAGGQPPALTLSWHDDDDTTTGYEYCLGTVLGDCNIIPWTSTGANTSAAISGLAFNTTYYWQVRTDTTIEANGGVWWSFSTVPQVIPSTWVGGVAIQSDQSIVAVTRPHLGSQIASYIGANAGSTTQYAPMLFKDAFSGGSYKSALYIQNLGNASASLTIEFIDDSGATVHTITEPLAAKASKGYWLSGIAGIPAGFAGAAKVTADQPVLAVGRPHIGAEVMSYNGMSAGSTTAWLPMFFKNGFGNYNTALYVQNITNASADLTIQYLNLDGTVACEKADTLAANASKGYWSLTATCDTGSLPVGFVGGVKVTSTENILTVGRAHLGAQITTYNGFAGGAPTAYVPMLFKNAFANGSYKAALYLQNVSGSSADVTIEYVNDAGAVSATQNVTLASGAISSIWLPGVAGLPDGFVGGARISSTQDIVAVGRPHLGTEITAYNGAPLGSTTTYLPMLFKNAFAAPYNAAFYIQNVTGNTANVNISFYDDLGALSCIKTISLAPNATQGFWMPTVSCAP